MSFDQDRVFSPEGLFLNALFSALNAAGVRYAVMRNYESLPYSANGSDLDILISPNDADRVREVVFEVMKLAGGVAIGVAESVGFFKVFALGYLPAARGAFWGLCLDCNIGLYFQGHKLLNTIIPWPLQHHNDIPVLEDGFAGVLGVLKEVLNNSVIPDRYISAARKASQGDWPRVEVLLAPMGSAALERLRRLLLSDASPVRQKEDCRRLRQEIFSQARLQGWTRAWWARASYEWSKVRRYLRPPGVVVAVLGVDGVGKSTVINAVLPVLKEATHSAVVVQHLRPTLLPPLARLLGKKADSGSPVLSPHGSLPSGMLGSLFRLTYLTADYIVGYWLWTRPRIAKQPTVVIFDRYAYDMVMDPRRFRMDLGTRIVSYFVALAPKPDIIFCLQGDPEVIVARKGELSVEETRRQVDALRAFAANEPRAILISTGTSIEDTRNEVLHALVQFCGARARASVQ